ncbi:hypothetical protein CAPTEDRAFT_103627 [Capitella teleta]|uniref:BTB domain-containing protein n=1 Tax=Capitella teleta TaxID=283909 RepID=R7V2R1_CAPTE|nr:hypothetical protein CAPTEDRAFT_103627 [Capitella teleta]|eukprot:ELU09991.1 hypothetical protein CAPTEDRAFT_103627 [Capitella teleta]
MREAEEFVDVALVFGERRVKCHKVILAGACDYFHRMFLTDMAESASKEVSMKGISANTGALLVDYLYGGRIEVTAQNAQDLLSASDMLLIDALKEDVEEFLCQNTGSSNCISLLHIARLYDLKALLKDAHTFLLGNIKEMIDSEELHLLQEGDLVDILIASYCQEDSFRLVQKWVRSSEARTDRFACLLEHVELSECSKEFICNTVMEEEFMMNKQGMKLIQKIMQSSTLADSSKKQALVVGNRDGKMTWVCADGQLWERVCKPPSQNQYSSACASPGGFIVSGGSHSFEAQADCYSYDVLTNEWTALPPMPTARILHSSVHHNHHLYIVGGSDNEDVYLDSVETLDMRSGQWSRLPPMPRPLREPQVVFVSNHLFVLGGFLNSGELSVGVHEYDAAHGTWGARCSLPEECEGADAVCFGGDFFVVGGDDRCCMRFNTSSDSWTKLQGPPYDHYWGPSFVWRNKIILCGGEDRDSIEEYSPGTDSCSAIWTLKMPNRKRMRFAFRIDVP